MDRFELVVPISPVPCPRPRVTKKGWTYYPAAYKAWKEEMGRVLPALLEGAGLTEPMECPVWVVSRFVCKRPKATKLAHPKPDIDNFEKSLFDALTFSQAWADDSQVVRSHSRKVWSEPGEPGRIEVAIGRWDD
jgi:Holliday junction resolvase RusA-like endonuclease